MNDSLRKIVEDSTTALSDSLTVGDVKRAVRELKKNDLVNAKERKQRNRSMARLLGIEAV